MNAPSASWRLAGACALALALTGPTGLAAAVQEPAGPDLTRFVRVDVLSSAVAEGLAAAMPVDVLPVALVRDEQALRYERLYLPPSFATGYELVKRAGGWCAVEKGAKIPISLFECTFPRAVGPILEAVVRGANSNVFADLELGEKLELLGIAGFGTKGQDLSSVLRIPVRAPNTTISKGFQLIFSKPFESPDPAKFQVSGVPMVMAQFLDGVGLPVPGSGHVAPLHSAKPDWDQAVQLFVDGSAGDFAPFAVVLRFRGGQVLRGGALAQAAKTMARNFADDVGGPLTNRDGDKKAKTPRYRVTYCKKAGRLGYQTLSSFSVPAPREAGAGAGATQMNLNLTALTVGDAALASLALRRELARALRTSWLLYGCEDATLVPAEHAKWFSEALLRSTLPLWEYLACDNALKGLEGVDAYPTVSPIVRRRLSDDFIKLRGLLENPPTQTSERMGLPDCFVPAYPRFHDRPADHRYAKAVWTSWDQWGHTSPSRTVDALVSAVASGYTSDATSLVPTTSVLAYFGATSPAEVQARYGVTVAQFQPKLTDLEWLAQGVAPVQDPLALPSSPVSTGTTMTPLAFPFAHLQAKLAGKRLVGLVRGQAPPMPELVTIPGVVAIDWGDWAGAAVASGATGATTVGGGMKPGDPLYVLPGDPQVGTDVQGLFTNLWASHLPKDSTAFTYVTTPGYDGKSSAMATQLTSSAERARLEARHYFHARSDKAMRALLARLKECLKQPQVTLVTLRARPGNLLVKDLVDLGSKPALAGTTDAPGALLEMAVNEAYEFVDQQVWTEPVGVTRPVVKAKLLDDLRKKVLLEPRSVPPTLLARYLSQTSYTLHSLLFHLDWAAQLLKVRWKLYERKAGTVTRYTVPASPKK